MSELSKRRRFPAATPDGEVARVLLAFLATAGIFYVNIMPAIVDGLIVVDSNLDSDVAIGNEKLGLLWIERHPTQVRKPDLDPGVAPLSHFKS